MLNRLKNPLFILALASFVYQILLLCGVPIELEIYQQFVDLVCYILIGAGIYKSYDAPPKGEGE